MIGAIINAAGILLGGAVALKFKTAVSAQTQSALKVGLGAFTVWFGLKLTWSSLHGSFGHTVKQLAIVLLAMSLGKLLGRLLHLQKFSNSLGQFASRMMAAPSPQKTFNAGFLVGTALFCAAPLAILGSVQEGLTGFAPIFVVKALMDGLATMAFVSMFGWGALAVAIPVLAWEGALIRCFQLLEPILRQQPWPLLDSITATTGLLIFSVALVILQLKKIEIADYLPSLALAPLLTWLFKL